MIDEKYENIISEMLLKLDDEQSTYQYIYRKLYGKEDENAKNIYKMMTDVCFTFRRKLMESKNVK